MAQSAFKQPLDIANRALQHCGSNLIASLTDDVRGAAEFNQCYDGLRDAELRRNAWTFAIKRAVLYPINSPITGLTSPTTSFPSTSTATGSLPTMLLIPGSWSTSEVYQFGSIITHNNNTWVSTIPANVGQEPGAAGVTTWDTYFGSMNVQPYDSTRGYYAGDLVYEDNSAGQINVFVSLQNSNTNDPSAPTLYSATATYSEGAVVQDAQGFFWRSQVSLNTGNQPGVYGLWSVTPTYVLGAYAIGSDYNLYQCLVATSHNQNPVSNPADWLLIGKAGSWPQWSNTITYAAGAVVMGADGSVYRALKSALAQDPTKQPAYNPLTPATNYWYSLGFRAPWVAQFSGTTANSGWLRLDASIEPLNISYPLGTGPSIETDTRNVFQLPHGFLRQAPDDPKAGSSSFLGAPSGIQYKDWVFDGNYIISRQFYPIILRFVADVTQVPQMDPMFCEGLAARVATQIVEPLTQSGAKRTTIENEYARFIGDARTVNGIEQGATEPPEDDYITCRV